MSYAAAKLHESSEEHVKQIEKEEWTQRNWGADCGEWEANVVLDHSAWTKVDKKTLIVQYWCKGVLAADRGEELKFELFLETLED